MVDTLIRFAAACTDDTKLCSSYFPNPTTNNDKLQTAAALFWAITAAVSLLVLTISGFRYIISRGDPGAVSKAKNAIIYSLVGLVVSMSAFAIVSFVVNGTTN